jgi:hypothetical protein
MKQIGLCAAAAALVCFGLAPVVLSFGRGGGGRGGGGYRGGGAAVSRPGGGYAAGGYRSAGAVGPYGGSAAGTRSGGTVVGPAGGSAGYRSGSGTVTTPRGGTVNYGGAATGRTGPAGGAAGRYVGGVQVTTPGGRTATKVGTGKAAVGPGGNAVGGRTSVGTATGPRGTAAGVSRSGTAVGPGGAVHSSYRGGAAVGPYGAAAGGARRTTAVGPAGAATVRRGTSYVSGGALRTQGAYVRSGFRYYGAFTTNWYARYPTAWRATRWAAASVWVPATWGAVYRYCGYPATPVYYDYGTTVVYQGDTVYIDGDAVGTAAQYAQQATEIANTGETAKPVKNEEWQPLGVFAMVRGDEQTSDKIFQLAVNKAGVIRGNYYDAFADNTLPVSGSVDRKTQRAAWSIGGKQNVVFEAGIANLTRDETSILVHYGKDNTQQFTLVRLEQPKKG